MYCLKKRELRETAPEGCCLTLIQTVILKVSIHHLINQYKLIMSHLLI